MASSSDEPKVWWENIKNIVTNKPLKKIYRMVVLGLMVLVVNNTTNPSSSTFSDIFNKILNENLCKNNTLII